MNNKAYLANIKKELWEFHNILFRLPVIIALLVLVTPVLIYFNAEFYQSERWQEALLMFASTEFSEAELANFGQASFVGMFWLFVPFIVVSILVQLYYFTSCLFDERRDKSVYFWRSLPVSDLTTLSSKLVTGALAIPAIFMVAATATLLVITLVAAIASLVVAFSYDVSIMQFWVNMGFINNLSKIWLALIPYAIWLLPLFAWFMLASMIANKSPFLWAVLPFVSVLIIEAIVVKAFNLSSFYILPIVGGYFEISPELLRSLYTNDVSLLPLQVTAAKVSFTGIAVFAALFYATYWLRVNRSHA